MWTQTQHWSIYPQHHSLQLPKIDADTPTYCECRLFIDQWQRLCQLSSPIHLIAWAWKMIYRYPFHLTLTYFRSFKGLYILRPGIQPSYMSLPWFFLEFIRYTGLYSYWNIWPTFAYRNVWLYGTSGGPWPLSPQSGRFPMLDFLQAVI